MHTILGAGGPVADALTALLLQHGELVRLVSRKPVTKFSGAGWVKADLTKGPEVLKAVEGASVIYMCAGLKYDKKVWAAEWPQIMQNLIAAARHTGARLIFFDNVYMYGKVEGAMREDTPYHPSSVKGKIRTAVADGIMREIKEGNIRGAIARAADFYGALSMNSFLDSMVLAKYAKKEKASWLGNPATKHSFTYVPDAGRAMYLLGQTESADGQVWHVPTATSKTGSEFIQLAASVYNATPRYQKVNKLMLQAIGWFNPLIGETAEMYYQYQYDYIFDSSKFEKAFGVKPTSYEEGFKEFARVINQSN